MARKKTVEELRKDLEKAEQDLKIRQENLKKLKQKEAELSRKQRTHRLCTHGAILEQYLPPDEFTDEQIEQILKSLFRKPGSPILHGYIEQPTKSQETT